MPSTLKSNCSGWTTSCFSAIGKILINSTAISRELGATVVFNQVHRRQLRIASANVTHIGRVTTLIKMQSSEGVSQLVEHLFRHEASKMVATLTRIFGVEHLNLAEDVMQEALGRALQTWPYRGIPENPSAWIMRASRNLALDVIRREKVFRGKEAEIAHLIEAGGSSVPQSVGFSESEIADDRL